jgi:hypothetical protein
MPQNERSLKRHERSYVLRNEARRIVSNRTICRNRSTVGEGTVRSDEAFATIHGVPDWVLLFLRLRVEFDSHGVGIDIIQKDLNLYPVRPRQNSTALKSTPAEDFSVPDSRE